jgi:preprotein translocase subunit SecA
MLRAMLTNFSKPFLSNYQLQMDKINLLENNFKFSTEIELKERTNCLKQRLLKGESKTVCIPESFALIREASWRVLGLRHYDVQLMGGLVLLEGKIAEMKTGEGKTLVALLPTFLNALYGKGTHVVTVNDYLAKRDAKSIGKVHRFLGLTVGLIQQEMEFTERKENYNCDITYVSNDQLAFDYLRDNIAYETKSIVQRPFFYCVIDEVDSILIDEARTPLIISRNEEAPTVRYLETTKLAKALTIDIHYKVDEKTTSVNLTNEGITFCEQALGIIDLFSPDEPWIFYVLNSIKAKELFQRNKRYIIDDNKNVVIVDEFTGRTMVGRRWSDGLHQAVEAKENLPLKGETQPVASISYQNLFLLYKKFAGMTGTAKTEEAEFEKIYNLKVVVIPTNRKIRRKDLGDFIYKNSDTKWRCIAQECLELYNIGRPVLIGTVTIENSELLAYLLNQYNLPYKLLNARRENIASESDTISQAGCEKAITIATNMAARGTDILLGGNSRFLTSNAIKTILKKTSKFKNNRKNLLWGSLIEGLRINCETLLKQSSEGLEKEKDLLSQLFFDLYNSLLSEQKFLVAETRKSLIDLGGLHVIGTEKHDSRRIDNQLRGRAGRQGDPGSSRFFLSLEDKLLRLFGGKKVITTLKIVGIKSVTIQFKSSILELAQKKVESFYFEARNQAFKYDIIINIQRNKVYDERRCIFETRNVCNWLIEYGEKSCVDLGNKLRIFSSPILKLQTLLGGVFPINFAKEKNQEIPSLFLQQQIETTYELRETEQEASEKGLFKEVAKLIMLEQIDRSWTEHLQKIGFLRDAVKWRAYGQKKPLTEFNLEAFNLFNIMFVKIRHRIVYSVLESKIFLD